MTSERLVSLELSRLEGAHLASLVDQFAELIADAPTDGALPDDPAVARLVPDAYAEDEDASREFRSLTGSELLGRRGDDARVVLAALSPDGHPLDPDLLGEEEATATFIVTLDPAQLGAWLRTIAAVRLVLATRLGIRSEEDHDPADPRFGIYDWLGYRLDGLVTATDPD